MDKYAAFLEYSKAFKWSLSCESTAQSCSVNFVKFFIRRIAFTIKSWGTSVWSQKFWDLESMGYFFRDPSAAACDVRDNF